MTGETTRLRFLLGVVMMTLSVTALAQAPKYQDGVHYTTVPDAPVSGGDKIEVVEAFSYMCPHCGTFEPYVESWQSRQPEHVEFRRIPAVFGRSSWELYARAYVTAEMMGIADESHGALMDRIWKENTVLRDMDQIAEFYSAFGAKPAEFVAMTRSFAVDARLRRDQRLLQAVGVRGTPSMIVNNKYLVAGNSAVPNFDVLLDVVDYLVATETDAQSARTAAGGSEAAGESAATQD